MVGLVAIAAGVLVIVWHYDWWEALPNPSDTSSIQRFFEHEWWPWIEGAAGVVLVLIGLRWLLRHLPSAGIKEFNLPSGDGSGRGTVNARSLLSTALDVLSDAPGVRAAKGTMSREDARLVVRIRATAAADADLDRLADATDEVMQQLASASGRNDLETHVHITVSGKARRTTARVI